MSSAHYAFSVSIPAGTLSTAPVEIATTFDPGLVDRIIVVTPGATTTGIRIAMAHQQLIPTAAGTWLVSSNASQNFLFYPKGYPDTGQWSVYGYNTAAAAIVWNVYYDVESESRSSDRTYLYPPHIPVGEIYAAGGRLG